MNIYLVGEYVKRLTKDDVKNFALSQGVILEEQELDIIYDYIKKYYKTIIYGNARSVLDELKDKVRPITYQKIETLYLQFKDKI